MSQSLLTGVSGLRAHQDMLDLVANNLANLNTLAFKSQSMNFADLIYNTRSSGSGLADQGGNIQQIGTGVQLSQISRNFAQGALVGTGEPLDFALSGAGFFAVSDNSGQDFYTRAGSFALDRNGYLIDPATGFFVQRVGGVGEEAEDVFGFQQTGDNRISIPLGAPIPGETTNEINFLGNLPASASPPVAELLTSAAPYSTATGVADASTLLNDLDNNAIDYVAGDIIEIRGTNTDGTPISIDLAADTATLGDIINQLNTVLVDAQATLGNDGHMRIEADEPGEAFLSVTITDAVANTGSTKFAEQALLVETDGAEGDIFETSLQVYDLRGESRNARFQFQKQDDNTWDVTVSLDDDSGVVLDSQVTNLRFNEDGTYAAVGVDGDGDGNIEFQFDSLSSVQTINLNFDELSHIAAEFGMSHQQDGTPPGNLANIVASGDGVLHGLASNGKNFPLAQLAIASFANIDALEARGQNYFSETIGSGSPQLGSGGSNGRGQVIGNQLETSNVDIAQEFTRLIVAQRGFSANARTISVADELLEELTNIIR